jgi:hypothetical protein
MFPEVPWFNPTAFMRRQASMMDWRFSRALAVNIRFPCRLKLRYKIGDTSVRLPAQVVHPKNGATYLKACIDFFGINAASQCLVERHDVDPMTRRPYQRSACDP